MADVNKDPDKSQRCLELKMLFAFFLKGNN